MAKSFTDDNMAEKKELCNELDPTGVHRCSMPAGHAGPHRVVYDATLHPDGNVQITGVKTAAEEEISDPFTDQTE